MIDEILDGNFRSWTGRMRFERKAQIIWWSKHTWSVWVIVWTDFIFYNSYTNVHMLDILCTKQCPIEKFHWEIPSEKSSSHMVLSSNYRKMIICIYQNVALKSMCLTDQYHKVPKSSYEAVHKDKYLLFTVNKNCNT